MSDLSDFLLARIADDEQTATAARDAPPVYDHYSESALDELVQLATNEGGSDAAAEHARRWTTERVLAECAAKRDLIEWALGIDYLVDVDDPAAPRDRLGDAVLRIVAQPYADHPDYPAERSDTPS